MQQRMQAILPQYVSNPISMHDLRCAQERAEAGDLDVIIDAIDPEDPLLSETLEMRGQSEQLRKYLNDASQWAGFSRGSKPRDAAAAPEAEASGSGAAAGGAAVGAPPAAAAQPAEEAMTVMDNFAVQHLAETIRSADVMSQWKKRSAAALGEAAALREAAASSTTAAAAYEEEAEQLTQQAIDMEQEGRTDEVR